MAAIVLKTQELSHGRSVIFCPSNNGIWLHMAAIVLKTQELMRKRKGIVAISSHRISL